MITKKPITRRSFLKSIGAAVAALGVSANPNSLAFSEASAQNTARTYAVGLRVKNGAFVFDPVAIRIAPGDTITWFQIADLHSTTAYHPTNQQHELRIPAKAKPWDSGILGTGGRGLTFSQKFDVEGVYDYFCLPHEFLGMVGRFFVGKPDAGGPASKPITQGIPQAGQKVLPSIDILNGSVGTLFTADAELQVPTLRIFEKKNDLAKTAAEQLLIDFDASKDKDGSLFKILEQAGSAEKYRAALVQYRDLVKTNIVFADALKKADDVKAILEEVRKKLNKG